jgi:hypothetical protein
MRTSDRSLRVAALVAVAALAAAPAAAPGQGNKPPKQGQPSLTLTAKPTTIVFGTTSAMSGRLSGTQNDSARVIRLEADATRPYGDAYTDTGLRVTTAQNGTFKLSVSPAVNTQYRVVAETAPPVVGGARLIVVRPRIGLVLSDATPRRGARVRFSGSVTPAHDGATALIQRRGSTGRFVTIARTTLQDAGDARSRYSRRVRITRDGVYRVKLRGHDDHVNGFSARRTIDVRG